jgi:spermidine synthase
VPVTPEQSPSGAASSGGPVPGWATEAITPSLHQLQRIRREVFSGQTKYQQVRVLDTVPFGRVLVLDGKTQSSQADEYVYHETLVHPAMLAASPAPRRVFIGGGGEGATLREVLAHKSVQRAVMVDLDEEVVELCKEHLPTWHQGSFEDPRTELRHEDAYAYLLREREPFDVLIMDLVDPMEAGPAYKLYTQEFYRIASERLSPGGTLVVQSGPGLAGTLAGPAVRENEASSAEVLTDLSRGFTALHKTLETVFPIVRGYSTVVPAFGSMWTFILASKGADDPYRWTPEDVDRRIAERVSKEPAFYDGISHRRLFSLPKPLRKALEQETWVVTEQRPLLVP